VNTEMAYDDDQKRLNIKAFGNATVDGFRALNAGMVEHAEWKSGTKVLCDFRALDLSNIYRQDAEGSAEFFRSFGEKNEGVRIACVMNKELDYGMARMWATLTMSHEVSFEIMVYRSIDDAVQWLHS
jgi:hypothetical protein